VNQAIGYQPSPKICGGLSYTLLTLVVHDGRDEHLAFPSTWLIVLDRICPADFFFPPDDSRID